MKFTHYILVGLLGLCCTGCNNQPEAVTSTLSVKEGRLIDSRQRTVILNGVNHVVKDPKQGYVYHDDERLFKQFRIWGINCIRYGIHWDGLEPEPGKINEAYLAEIDKRVQWARDNDLYLILDMHQDLYGKKFDNGAPVWATLDEGLPHITGQVWSDAYLMSPAVQKAFDNFWKNAPAADSVGIQDHYINVWKTLAKRYADSTSVIGFDVFNEPFMGTRAQSVFQKLMEGCAVYLAEKKHRMISEEEIMDIWTDEKKRTEMLEMLDDQETFHRILQYASELVDSFEKHELSHFYQKLRDAVRSTGNKQILFLEHNYFCNMGIESTFKVPLMANGKQDTLCAYAPHAYDLVVDTDGATHPGFKRLNTIFEQLQVAATKRHLPLLIGEWGAFYMGDNYKEPAAHQIGWIAKLLAGHTYWSWWPDMEKQDYFDVAISRPYPQYINGRLVSYEYDMKSNVFTCEWEESGDDANSRFFMPDISLFKEETLELTPATSVQFSAITEGTTAGYLEIEPTNGHRTLTIHF